MQIKHFSRNEVPSADPTWERCTWGLPNIVYFAKDRGDPPEQVGMPSMLRDVVFAVAKAKPRWTLYIINDTGRSITVCQDKEWLGHFHYTSYGRVGVPNIVMNSHALDAKLTRGADTKTGDTKKATSLILKNFAPIPVLKQVQVRANRLKELTDRHKWDADRKTASPLHSVAETVRRALRENNEELVTTLLRLGIPQHTLEPLPDLLTAKHEADRLSNQIHNKLGTHIFVEPDGVYLTVRYDKPEGQQAMRHNSMTLPEHLRGPLGMLKLVDNNTVIDGIGARLDENTFFLMD